MSGSFEIAILSGVDIIITLRELDKIYEKGKKVEEYLKECYPKFNIRCSNWRVNKAPTFYEIKIGFVPEEARKVGVEIKEKIGNFLKTIE